MKKLLVAMLSLALLLAGCTTKEEVKKDSITVNYVDVTGKTVESHEIEFTKEDTLVGLVEKNFDNVTVDNGMLLTIEDYETPEDWSTFIGILVNDEMSEVGIEDIELADDMKVTLQITELNY